ncbi:MAG: hypothetical protein U0174_27175 [Polyangiaceae bacterium]
MTDALAEVTSLLQEATALMKSDAKAAVGKLEAAYALASENGAPSDQAAVAEELARGYIRRKAPAQSLHYACKATKLTPERKSAWNTLGKTCELLATRTDASHRRRGAALFRGAAMAFKKAASLTKDPEDKRWLLELASDAAKQGKVPATT